jgi:hypothetical protein
MGNCESHDDSEEKGTGRSSSSYKVSSTLRGFIGTVTLTLWGGNLYFDLVFLEAPFIWANWVKHTLIFLSALYATYADVVTRYLMGLGGPT